MIVQTPAIVLKRFPYGDTSVIAHCFTRDYGKVGIMVRGAHRKKSPRSAYFQPGNYLEMLFYYKQNEVQNLLKSLLLYLVLGILPVLRIKIKDNSIKSIRCRLLCILCEK